MPATNRFCLSSSGLNLTQYGTFLLVKREMHWPVESSKLKKTQSLGIICSNVSQKKKKKKNVILQLLLEGEDNRAVKLKPLGVFVHSTKVNDCDKYKK